MENVILFPLLVTVVGGVIVLVVEYWIIQPKRRTNEVIIPLPHSIGRGWASAMKRAVQEFKRQQPGYKWKWWLLGSDRITIQTWKIERGTAVLTLAVSTKQQSAENPVPGIAILNEVWRVSAKYQLVIDRTGDILKWTPCPLKIHNLTIQQFIVKEICQRLRQV